MNINKYFREEALRAYEEGYDSVEFGEFYQPISIKLVVFLLVIAAVACVLTYSSFLPRKTSAILDCDNLTLLIEELTPELTKVGVWIDNSHVYYIGLAQPMTSEKVVGLDADAELLDMCSARLKGGRLTMNVVLIK